MAPPPALTLASLVYEDACVYARFAGRLQGNASLTVGEDGERGRHSLMASLGLTPSDAVFMRQVHGAVVARVGGRDRGRGTPGLAPPVPGVDALVTTEPGVVLVALTADCVPVLLIDPGGQSPGQSVGGGSGQSASGGSGVAAVHAGRRGVSAGVVPAAVRALVAATGSQTSAVRALIGPAIGGCCYEVASALAAEVAAAVPSTSARTTWGASSLDLRAGVEAQLEACGVTAITRYGDCTRCLPDRWFSHRAVSAGYAAGRNAAVIVRRGA